MHEAFRLEITIPEYDVVVVGLGPAGAVATCFLGQQGIRTLALDKSRNVWNKPRAIAIDHEILRLFQNLGLAERVLPYTAPFPPSEHYGTLGQLIRRIDTVPPPYPLGYAPTMVFTQPEVEKILRSRAAEYPAVTVSLGTEVIDLQQKNEKVILAIEDERGQVHRVQSSYVVACDGASSTIRQLLSIALDDLTFDEQWMVVDVKVNEKGLARLPSVAAQYCDPRRPATFIVGPGNHRRWEIMILPGEDATALEAEHAVWDLLSPWLHCDEGELWRASSYRFHALVAQEWRKGRVFLAGDAAHQQPPFLGQGMCQGIRDVSNLTWKLSAVLRGGRPLLLDTYAVERNRHVRTLIERVTKMGREICQRDPVAARLRDENLLRQGGGFAPTITRQEIIPPLDRGLLFEASEPVGTLFPQPFLAVRGARVRMDDYLGNGWRLILDGRQCETLSGLADAEFAIGIVGGQAGVEELDDVLASWFDKYSCIGALVRPDHYVYGVIRNLTDVPQLAASLREYFDVTLRYCDCRCPPDKPHG